MKSRCSRRRGFTLLEVAIAMAILGVGVTTCFEIFGSSLRLEERASRQTRAAIFARGIMDALLYDPNFKTSPACEDRPTAEGFRRRCNNHPAGPEDGVEASDLGFVSDWVLWHLEVEVAWEDGTGLKTYNLKSLRMAPNDD